MTHLTSIVRGTQLVAISLVTDHRVQAAFALALALIASVVLGSENASAGWSTSPG